MDSNTLLLWCVPIFGLYLIISIIRRSKLNHFFETIIKILSRRNRIIEKYATKGVKLSSIITNIEIVAYIFTFFLALNNDIINGIYKGLFCSVLIYILLILLDFISAYYLNRYAYLVKRVAKDHNIEIE